MKNIVCAFLVSGAVLVLTANANALELWSGEKFIHSVDGENTYFIKVNIVDATSGGVTSNGGKSNFSYSKNEGKVALALTGDISIVSFPIKVNYKACELTAASVDCSPQQVRQVNTLQAISLSGQEPSVEIVETWNSCAEFLTSTKADLDIVCETYSEEIKGGLYMEDSVTSSPIDVKVGDKVVVSVPSFSSVYIQLNKNDSVTVLSAGFDVEGGETFDANSINSWKLKNGQLVLGTKDDGQLVYSKTQIYDGVSRIVGEYENAKLAKTFSGSILVDEGIDMSSATVKEVSGLYKTVSVGTVTKSYDIEYIFDADGFGGFENYGGYSVEPRQNIWAWDLVGGELVAKQYRSLESGIPIMERAEQEACLESLDKNPSCTVRMDRSYKLIAQDGNRYTMLRTLKFYSPESEQPVNKSLSVWVFYKK